jgi:general secretion pathway protein M
VTLGAHLRLDRIAALAILAAVLVLFWLGPVGAYLDFVSAGADQLGLAQQNLQRYRALGDGADPALAAPRADAALLFPEIPDSQAAALLQETLKSAATAAQVQIQGLQVLRADPVSGAVRTRVQVRASGDIASLGRLLYAIEAARPVLYADNLHVQSRPMQTVGQAAGSAAVLDFQLDVSGFRAGPAT